MIQWVHSALPILEASKHSMNSCSTWHEDYNLSQTRRGCGISPIRKGTTSKVISKEMPTPKYFTCFWVTEFGNSVLSFLRSHQTVLHSRILHFCKQCVSVLISTQFHQHFIFCFKKKPKNYSNGCEVVFHCGFVLHFSND